MNFREFESQRKLSGEYYTPAPLADFLAKWVLAGEPRSVLEPSCGDGAFFRALESACTDHSGMLDVTGVDIDGKACNELSKYVPSSESIHSKLVVSDFLKYSISQVSEGVEFDAVIGNPPFIRYQYLDGEHQDRTKLIFDQAGLKFTKHTNAWVPFIIQGVRLLRPGGRLGMVVPSELMHVLHAKPLRQFLVSQCERISVVHLEDLFSEEVLQGVVLLLCEKAKETSKKQAKISFPKTTINGLVNGQASNFIKSFKYASADGLDHKWMGGLLTPEESSVYAKARALDDVNTFVEIADVDVGIVTGANKFFLIPNETVERFSLEAFVHPMFGRSSHVSGVEFTKADHRANAEKGLPTNFLYLRSTDEVAENSGLEEYLLSGEEGDLHKRYKCRIRKPWYAVPSVWAADIAMLKRAHHVPRLILNSARAYTTDTAYRITMKTGSKSRASDLVGCFVNSLTALSAELEGRHYGGGVIELVPSEIERLLIPFVKSEKSDLKALDKRYRSGTSIEEVLRAQDVRILKSVGLNDDEITIIHNAWKKLMKRRHRVQGSD